MEGLLSTGPTPSSLLRYRNLPRSKLLFCKVTFRYRNLPLGKLLFGKVIFRNKKLYLDRNLPLLMLSLCKIIFRYTNLPRLLGHPSGQAPHSGGHQGGLHKEQMTTCHIRKGNIWHRWSLITGQI